MGRPRAENKRTERITTPASEQELAAWQKACADVDVEPADTLRKLAAAFKAHVDEYGYITFPIRFAPPEKKPRKQ